MNSFIRTEDGFAIVVGNKPYTVQDTHANFDAIRDALRERRWSDVPDLINLATAVSKYIKATSIGAESELSVDVNASTVLFRGQNIPTVLAEHILTMAADRFDIKPMEHFLTNLYENPSYKAIQQLYGWMSSNGITITYDGYLIAYKRVRDDYKSFFDSKTDNTLLSTPELPRNAVDDRSENTCSAGLHFCAQSYLPHYAGGQGRVLLLKIHPRDVVSIPTDYNFAKGRACKYFVMGELKGDTRSRVEVADPLPMPVITETTAYNESDEFKAGYAAGYKDGRGKQARFKSANDAYDIKDVDIPYTKGYNEGFADGRAKKPKLY